MNLNDERTLDEVEAQIVSPERSEGMEGAPTTTPPWQHHRPMDGRRASRVIVESPGAQPQLSKMSVSAAVLCSHRLKKITCFAGSAD